jgi:uncharacterized protein YbaR (Trm112 family)
MNEIKIGMWACPCCHRDLYQIQTEEEINTIIEDWDEGISHDVYDSKKEALLDIRKGFTDIKTLNVIDKIIGE